MKSEKGQSMVETALILPIVLMLLFGIVDFGRIFHAYLTLDHAGREAARLASIQKSNADITSKISSSTAGLDSSKLTVTISPNEAARTSGTDATITLVYKIDFITPFVTSLASPLTLTDTTVMRVE
ncbi:TadE/TadG family type IV pilus assembly protein [Bacillus sp. B-jedd]|uniref:TadE/TadG family type IV pilus assembly protein n=1 Tax=Bacillus sp. B-jedd TaxID=1476857 RepID=UPI0005155DCD|nr:TadE/TadG family type IV pilus assembly protein [Bacillus sp. B-jedd]CEG28321.1 TadE-like protein [Bacillus sp. B-jedd]